MLTGEEIAQLVQSLIWLLAGVGVFIVGMGFMSAALEKSAGNGMKKLLGKISNNRFSGVGIGAGVTAIIQSSTATIVLTVIDYLITKFTGLHASAFGKGFIGFVLSAVVLYVTQYFVAGYTISWVAAIIGALVYGVVDYFLPGDN